DLYNPLTSLRYGCTILRHYLDRYKNQERALAAYNGSLGYKTYPRKVLGRLASKWQFKKDEYAREPDLEIAQGNQSGGGTLILE
ncbi:MAG: lytic transglycosylase domain-containing protein, partial [Arenicella sp.]|nr:lytic transglycosylase domain-containing protein [Arenicella sp.]